MEDPATGCVYLYLRRNASDGWVKRSVQVAPNVVLDYDEDGLLGGVEIIQA